MSLCGRGGGKTGGGFAFLLGPEPNYERIDGAWRNSLPYGTIHRVASDGRVPGFFDRCMEFCKKQTANLRIDKFFYPYAISFSPILFTIVLKIRNIKRIVMIMEISSAIGNAHQIRLTLPNCARK